MASNFEDPYSWRLQTNGGIPYKQLAFTGEFEKINATATTSILIPADRMLDFMAEVFPPSFAFGDIYIPQYAFFQNTRLAVKKVAFRPFIDDYPIDPFGWDTFAAPGTYHPIIRLDIELETPPLGGLNPLDPVSFLEISAEASGEYVHSPPINAKSQPVTGSPTGATTASGTATRIRTPILPHTILIPHTLWTISWKRIPYPVFTDKIAPRLLQLLGKVNNSPFDLLAHSVAETLLLVGYNFRFEYTWNGAYADVPFVELSVKILEKRVVWNGIIRGHQDVWRPGYGWDRLLINGLKTYETYDFNTLTAP